MHRPATRTPFWVELRQRPARQLPRPNQFQRLFMDRPRYEVLLNGRLYDSLYFDSRGYVGYLPEPPTGKRLFLGEVSLARYQQEVERINRLAAGEEGEAPAGETTEAEDSADALFEAAAPAALSSQADVDAAFG